VRVDASSVDVVITCSGCTVTIDDPVSGPISGPFNN